MRRLLLLAAALGGCNRNFAVPAAADRTPPVLTRFAASPPFAKAGATVTITFDANEELSSAAAQLAGKNATCTVHASSASCTVVVDTAFAEGDQAIDVKASDQAH